MKPVIYIDENIPFLPGILSDVGTVHIFAGRDLERWQLADSGCEILIVRSTTKVNAHLLDGTSVKFVATATSGSDHFDSAYLRSRDIRTADAIGSNAVSVAEYVIFGLLHWARYKEADLRGKAIGIIGFGNIGRLVAEAAHGLGITVYVNDPPLSDSGYPFPEYARIVPIEELAAASHIVTNHVPLNKIGTYNTDKLIDHALLERMPRGGLLIHTSRGGIVDEGALSRFLSDMENSAIMDVWQGEPDFDIALAEKTLIATPHIAGHSIEAKLKAVKMIADVLAEYLGRQLDTGAIDRLMSRSSEITLATPADDLYRALLESRKLTADDNAMRKLFRLPHHTRKDAFDELRRKYPARHEILFPGR